MLDKTLSQQKLKNHHVIVQDFHIQSTETEVCISQLIARLTQFVE